MGNTSELFGRDGDVIAIEVPSFRAPWARAVCSNNEPDELVDPQGGIPGELLDSMVQRRDFLRGARVRFGIAAMTSMRTRIARTICRALSSAWPAATSFEALSMSLRPNEVRPGFPRSGTAIRGACSAARLFDQPLHMVDGHGIGVLGGAILAGGAFGVPPVLSISLPK